MTEFAGVTGQTGTGKHCEECNRECTYIAVSGVYYECQGVGGCLRKVCDQCQQSRVTEFEHQPYLSLQKLNAVTNYGDLLAKLETH